MWTAEPIGRVGLRTFDPKVRERTLAAITRIVNAEAEASNAPKTPEIDHTDYFPPLVNDAAGIARTRAAVVDWLGEDKVIDPGVVTGSEDVGVLAEAAGAPCVFWILGGADPTPFTAATTQAELMEVVRRVPSNHSPFYAPVRTPTLRIGVDAFRTAVAHWLPPVS